MILKIAILMLIVGVNAFFAAAEVAFLSINPNKVRALASDGDKKSIHVQSVLADPSGFLASIQIVISLLGLISGAYTASALAEELVVALKPLWPGVSQDTLLGVSVVVLTLILSFFTLVFGELTPKRLAMKSSYSTAVGFVRIVDKVGFVLRPFVWLLSVSTDGVMRIFGANPHDKSDTVTEEEIRMMVDVGGTAGTIDETEKEMINNVFDFGNKTAEDVATHRRDVVAIPIDASRATIISSATEEMFSRILIYEDNIDNVVGVLYVKDLLRHLLIGGGGAIDLKTIMRKPHFVPASKKADELFEFMRKNKLHIAVVVDEYGGTAGIVTMEDLIEEIMGNILDEYDDEEAPDIQELPDNVFVARGIADLEEVAEFFDTDLPTQDYDTLSGFIVGQLGRIPARDEAAEFEFSGLVFKVEEVFENRIQRATIYKC